MSSKSEMSLKEWNEIRNYVTNASLRDRTAVLTKLKEWCLANIDTYDDYPDVFYFICWHNGCVVDLLSFVKISDKRIIQNGLYALFNNSYDNDIYRSMTDIVITMEKLVSMGALLNGILHIPKENSIMSSEVLLMKIIDKFGGTDKNLFTLFENEYKIKSHGNYLWPIAFDVEKLPLAYIMRMYKIGDDFQRKDLLEKLQKLNSEIHSRLVSVIPYINEEVWNERKLELTMSTFDVLRFEVEEAVHRLNGHFPRKTGGMDLQSTIKKCSEWIVLNHFVNKRSIEFLCWHNQVISLYDLNISAPDLVDVGINAVFIGHRVLGKWYTEYTEYKRDTTRVLETIEYLVKRGASIEGLLFNFDKYHSYSVELMEAIIEQYGKEDENLIKLFTFTNNGNKYKRCDIEKYLLYLSVKNLSRIYDNVCDDDYKKFMAKYIESKFPELYCELKMYNLNVN